MTPRPPPTLTPPTLHTSASIKSSPQLTASITALVNAAFARSSDVDTAKWDKTTPRFSHPDSLHDMLRDEKSVMALVFDEAGSLSSLLPSGAAAAATTQDLNGKKLVACAAALPWAGGWRKEGAGVEQGWEIKTICVDGDEAYHHRGLAVKLLGFLEDYLINEEKKALLETGKVERVELGEGKGKGKGNVTLWILAAECINGVYWRKRGYTEVRRRTEGPGTWANKKEFDMVVLKRDVEFELHA